MQDFFLLAPSLVSASGYTFERGLQLPSALVMLFLVGFLFLRRSLPFFFFSAFFVFHLPFFPVSRFLSLPLTQSFSLFLFIPTLFYFVCLPGFPPNILTSRPFFLRSPAPFPSAYNVLCSCDKGTALFIYFLACLALVLLVKLAFFIIIFVIRGGMTEEKPKSESGNPCIFCCSRSIGTTGFCSAWCNP